MNTDTENDPERLPCPSVLWFEGGIDCELDAGHDGPHETSGVYSEWQDGTAETAKDVPMRLQWTEEFITKGE